MLPLQIRPLVHLGRGAVQMIRIMHARSRRLCICSAADFISLDGARRSPVGQLEKCGSRNSHDNMTRLLMCLCLACHVRVRLP